MLRRSTGIASMILCKCIELYHICIWLVKNSYDLICDLGNVLPTYYII